MTALPTARSILLSTLEDETFPNAVLAALKLLNGKQITVRILSKLPTKPNQGETWWRLNNEGGTQWSSRKELVYWCRETPTSAMTQVMNLVVWNSRFPAQVIDAELIEQENERYFAALRERNERRRGTLADDQQLARLDGMMSEARLAVTTVLKLTDNFSGTDDGYLFREACGLSVRSLRQWDNLINLVAHEYLCNLPREVK